MIIGYRPLTDAEIEKIRIDHGIAAGTPKVRTEDGGVIWYDPTIVLRFHGAGLLGKSVLEVARFLRNGPLGVILSVGPRPLSISDDGTDIIENPVFTEPLLRAPINLANYLEVSNQVIDRSYLKGSMETIPSEKMVFRNISDKLGIDIKLSGAAGVTYSPNNFSLAPFETKEITVTFNSVEVEKLNEGVSTISTKITLSSNTKIAPALDPIPFDPLLANRPDKPISDVPPIEEPIVPPPMLPPVQTPVTTGPDDPTPIQVRLKDDRVEFIPDEEFDNTINQFVI
jgi:hypothetical protein